jgi:hypothetical protein
MPPTRPGVPGVWPPGGCHVRFFFRFSLPSVPASFSGRVVLRAHRSGSVWAWRAVRRGDRPSPACLFLPAPSRGVALRWAACARFPGLVRFCAGLVSVARCGGLARWPPPRRPGLVRSCCPRTPPPPLAAPPWRALIAPWRCKAPSCCWPLAGRAFTWGLLCLICVRFSMGLAGWRWVVRAIWAGLGPSPWWIWPRLGRLAGGLWAWVAPLARMPSSRVASPCRAGCPVRHLLAGWRWGLVGDCARLYRRRSCARGLGLLAGGWPGIAPAACPPGRALARAGADLVGLPRRRVVAHFAGVFLAGRVGCGSRPACRRPGLRFSLVLPPAAGAGWPLAGAGQG